MQWNKGTLSKGELINKLEREYRQYCKACIQEADSPCFSQSLYKYFFEKARELRARIEGLKEQIK